MTDRGEIDVRARVNPDRNVYLQQAGRILWPRNTQDLTDRALCPACHTPLKPSGCSECRLNLRHAAATELLARSAEAAARNDRAPVAGH